MRGYITDPAADGGLRLAEDLPEPEPEPGEALLEVRAFAVNRGELTLLRLRADGWRPGQDLAGIVIAPPADGGGPAPGTRVVAVAEWHGWAERIALPLTQLAPIADTVSFEAAASLPIAGLTALRGLRAGGPILGRRVLITGATGGVGQFAVQLALAGGARVTAQVSAPEREAEARELGAHEVCVELDEELGQFDLVLDGVGGELLVAALHLLAPGGAVVSYGMSAGPSTLGFTDFRSAGGPYGKLIGLFHGYPQEERGADLGVLAGLVADGRLEPRIGSSRDWLELRQTLDDMRARRVRGRAVLLRS
jgi:NADPH2:quinone reductase